MNQNEQQKTKKKKKKKKGRFGRFLLYSLFVLFIVGLVAAGAVFQIVRSVIAETPEIEEYDINVLLQENSVLYDRHGELIEKIQDGGIRTIVQYSDIDQDILDIFIAVEDKTFYTHSGFNFVRLIGAGLEYLKGEGLGGTSTITQQYARNMYLTDTRFLREGYGAIERKIQEAYYTLVLEDKLSKEQIFFSYLNTIELGANVQGIQAATQRYFSKDANDVDYIEAAILAGIPKANSRYSPFQIKAADSVEPEDIVLGQDSDDLIIVYRDTATKRIQDILWLLERDGVISKEEYAYAKDYVDSGLFIERFKPGKFRNDEISSYFADMVKSDVINDLMAEKGYTQEEAERILYGGGLQIHSTLDLDIQRTVEKAYNSTEFNNLFDDSTKRAVVKFQEKYDLGKDGVVGPNTLKKLAELDLIVLEDFTKEAYYLGMRDDEILNLKIALETDGLLFKHNESLPKIEVHRDAEKNILTLIKDDDDEVVGSRIMLNYYDALINANEQVVVGPSDYFFDDAGNLVLRKNGAFDFSLRKKDGEVIGVDMKLKDTYKSDPLFERQLVGARRHYNEFVEIQEIYIFKGGLIKNIDYAYTSYDDAGNAVIAKPFLNETSDFYEIDDDNNLLINQRYYGIAKKGIIQPQSAFVLIDHTSGQLLSIVGGRDISGQKIYSRAINPRQPGSSIKPLTVYLPALDNGMTTATVFDDVPRYDNNDKRWPQNWYDHQDVKYWGIMTMRQALEMSNNVIAVKIVDALGIDTVVPYIEKLGLTTFDSEGGINDMNTSAIALGGMSVGLTPFDITGAYTTIPNQGVRNETITYTRVLDKNGTVILSKQPKQTLVADQQVTFLLHDILESGATTGLAKTAAFSPNNKGIPIAGKTGTTSNKNDAWFVGYSPYYTAGVWIGNDVQVPLNQGSYVAALFWKNIMGTLHEGLDDKDFVSAEEVGVIAMNVDSKSGKLPTPLTSKDPEGPTIIRELFKPGTQPTDSDDTHVEITYCSTTKLVATPYCPEETLYTQVMRLRLEEDYDPYRNIDVTKGQTPYYIKDQAYTLPRFAAYPPEDFDYVAAAQQDKPIFCYVHTGETRSAQTTMAILDGVTSLNMLDGSIVITESLLLTTKFGYQYPVQAGSIINDQGTIITRDGTLIYPWQIGSFEKDPTGPLFDPSMLTPTTEPSQEETTSEEPPLQEETSNGN